MERSNFSLRLLPSQLKDLKRAAEKENCSLNQLVMVAVAEKIARLDDEYWHERQRQVRSNPSKLRWSDLPGSNQPAREEDEIPAGFKRNKANAAAKRALKAGG